jgi:uncharacterized protein YuzE
MGGSMKGGIKDNPKINYDKGSDTLYIFVKGGEEKEFIEVADGISIELNKDKEILGIEILNASKVFEPLLKRK